MATPTNPAPGDRPPVRLVDDGACTTCGADHRGACPRPAQHEPFSGREVAVLIGLYLLGIAVLLVAIVAMSNGGGPP